MAGMNLQKCSLVLASLLGMGVALAQGSTEADLLRSARMWTAKNRPDLAREQLAKLLASNPDSPDAQVLLADMALRENKLAEAQKILQTLRLRHFQHPATRDLEQLVRIYGPEREKLARMRLLARGGNKIEAQALARELFPQGPPTVGGLDIEYYQLMAATAGGGVQAQKELQRLYRETGDARYRLAQLESQVQAGNVSNAVLSEFESLAQRADVNRPALQDLWRRAISRLPTNRASTAWIHAYLRWIPGERAMLEQLAELEGPAKAGTLIAGVDPMAATRAAGRKALDREENDVAEKKWLAVLASRPMDAEAQGSLGLVRLRQKRYAEAQEHFTRASQRDPQQKWVDLKKTAMVWGWLQMADTALANGDAALALAHVQQALELEPKNTSALRARASVYAKDGKPDQALALLEKAYQDDPDLAARLVDIRVELMREQASVDANANRMGAALRLLETAIPLEPDSPWLRHQLARLYLQLGMPDQALDVMNEGVARASENPEMRFARALVLTALDDPAAALADLQSVAAAQRSAAMQTLEQRVTVDLYIRQASSGTDARAAAQGLRDVEDMVGNDADLLYAVANAWFRHGLPHQGVAVYDRLAQRLAPLPPQVQLNHAVLRNRAQDDTALERQLPGLLQLPDWTPAQEAELVQLTSEHRERLIGHLLASQQVPQVQQAQELARQPMPFQTDKRSPQILAQSQKAQARLLLMVGALAEARVLLERALPALAQDVELRLELGDTYYRTGRLDEALVQARWLQANSDALKPYQQLALVRLLRDTGQEALARARAQWLLQRYPDDLDVVLYAARQERSNGEYSKALALFQRAYQLALAEGNTATATDALRLELAYNLVESGIGADATRIASDGPDAATLVLRFMDAMESTVGTAGVVRTTGAVSTLGTLEKIQTDVDAIEDRRQAWVELGLEQRERIASEGRSTLHGWEQPLVVMLPWRYDGRIFLHLDQVALDAGSLPGDVREFGQLAAWPAETVPEASLVSTPQVPQTARGLNLGIGYEGESLRWDLGSVGQGFPVSNIVGGLRQSGDIGPLGYSLELARRPMTGTLLSYAGARDPVTGAVWGGVVATSVGGRVSADVGAFGLSASTSFAVLSGRNVDDNQRFAWRLALDRDLYRSKAQQLNLGVSVSGVQFARDLSGFTWGHGGYYSPKSSTTLTLPLEWNGRNNAWSWLLRASVSASRSDSHSADYFPGNALLQSQAQTQGSDPVYAGGGGSLSSGYSLRGVLEYQTSARWILGARLEREVSDYYTPLNLLFYTRYLFDPVRGPRALQNDGVRPVRAYSSF